jgi:hypothetical protein
MIHGPVTLHRVHCEALVRRELVDWIHRAAAELDKCTGNPPGTSEPALSDSTPFAVLQALLFDISARIFAAYTHDGSAVA